VESRAGQGFSSGDLFADQSNGENYQSACPWDIYPLLFADEMFE
jgi:hypothetical protein